jgi:hypothetical protein
MFKKINKFKKIVFKKLPIEDDKSIELCSIAIIIPHQNNIEHLKKLLSNFEKESMINIRKNNRMDIYLIDQNNADKFNRGLLLNIGYLIAMKNFSYDRYIFHNIDYYPNEEIFKLYFKFINYNLHFVSNTPDNFIGGVFAIKKEDFEKINGFPNNFFGKNVENEAFYNRCAKYNLEIYKPIESSYLLENKDNELKIDKSNKYSDNILYDINKSYSNGLKQLLNFFINIKKYSIDDFISNYEIIDRNSTNDSEMIQSYIHKNIINQNVTAFKIDYLANHTSKFENLLNKDYVENKIKKRLEQYKGEKYFQHPKHKEIISLIEPLIYMDEINEKIINTYTELKPFASINKISKRENKIKNLVENNFEKYNITSEIYTKENLFSTIKFIFETFNELVYFRIRNNKIECAYHLYNLENNIDWFKYVKTIDNKTIDEKLIDIVNSYDKPYYTLRKPHFIPSNNCLMGFDSYNYWDAIPYGYIKEFKEIMEFTIEKFKNVPDCDILINRKDFALITKDHKYAYEHLVVGDQAKIPNINKFYFFGSQSIKDNNLDILIPSADEWKSIKIYENISIIKWKDKKPIGFFRGSATGCGQTIETNKRIHLADISYKWSKTTDKNNLLDCALSALTKRIRLYKQFIGISDVNKYNYLVGSFVNMEDQLKYKYIFNIEGNAQAYRYATEFRKQAVILNVESDYHMWFEPLLKENKNIVTIKGNYSNLEEKLQYLRENDDIAKKIANNGYKFSKKYINKDMIATYWFYYMLNVNKNTKNVVI